MNHILRKSGHSAETLTLIKSKMVVKTRSAVGDTIHQSDTLIRWGCTSRCAATITVNSAGAITKSSDKAAARVLFAENKIDIPATAYSDGDIDALPEGAYVVRPSKHYGGKNFNVADTKDGAKAIFRNIARKFGGAYCSILIKKTNEYRVHVAHGKVLGIQEKPLPEDGFRANMSVVGIPWRVLLHEDWPAKACRMAINSVAAVGLDFGAVDIIKGAGKSEFYVLEINTSPQIASDIISSKYAKYFDWLLSSNAKREHFALKAKLKAKGFAWTSSDFKL